MPYDSRHLLNNYLDPIAKVWGSEGPYLYPTTPKGPQNRAGKTFKSNRSSKKRLPK